MHFFRNRFLTIFLAVIFSLVFTKYYFLLTHEYYENASSTKMAEFEADKVFQKRVLPILLANLISEFTPLSLDHSLKALCVLSSFALLFGFHSLLHQTGAQNPHPIYAYIVFIPVGWNYLAINAIYHAYDIPTLAFYCWGIVLFLKRKIFFFYLLYLIAGLNRESTCFMTISIFTLLFRFPDRLSARTIWYENRSLFLHCFAQFIFWFVNKGALEYTFRDNPGTYYEQTLSMFQFLVNLFNGQPSWPYLDVSSFFGNPRCFLTLFACTWILLPFLWNHINSHAKKLLWIIPPYLLAATLHANLMESRVYHELNIVLSVAIASGILGIYNREHSIRINKKTMLPLS
jgi:hypothetical protein